MATVISSDIGTVIDVLVLDEAAAPYDFSDATITELIFKDPNGNLTTRSATPVSGKLRYVTVGGEFNTIGEWAVRSHLIGPGYDHYGSFDTFIVTD